MIVALSLGQRVVPRGLRWVSHLGLFITLFNSGHGSPGFPWLKICVIVGEPKWMFSVIEGGCFHYWCGPR